MSTLLRHVACALDAELAAPTGIVLAVAVARAEGLTVHESLDVRLDGRPVALTEVVGTCTTRWHTADLSPGTLTVRYSAEVRGRASPMVVTSRDRIEFVRPSRYVQSDELMGLLIDPQTVAHFADLPDALRVLAARDWVAQTLQYVPGSTVPTDGLPELLATRRGVCRDFAHLLAGVLRATDLPARVVSVYAPELVPMDFHAVVEVAVEGRWMVLDATGLAPRDGLLRIATGRDAADTAFLANDGSSLSLTRLTVNASADRPFEEQPETLLALG